MAIEGNRDDAEKCIEIAQNAMAAGDYGKAERFLLKAERLYPTAEAKELLNVVRNAAPSSSSGRQTPPRSPKADDVRRRKPVTSDPPQREYTADQMEAVKRIKKCKDYYEILGVSKEAPDAEIKKAYKKLALQLHPDKNHAPGAAEAFKVVGNAAVVLTDPLKRKQYDVRGEEPLQAQAHHTQYYARGFESDLLTEELFNMFFGGATPFPGAGGGVYRARRHREPEPREAPGGFVQLLPILLLVLVSMMSGFFISEPVYSLAPSHKYPVPRETQNLKVPYYVKEQFHSEYQGSLRRLEMSIEEEHLSSLRHACQRERNLRESAMWKARHFGEARHLQEAQRLPTPSCDKLHSYHR